jgi:transposase
METYVGIDVSKATFDVSLPNAKGYTNNDRGFARFLKDLPKGAHCVMEATGPYYLRLALYLHTGMVKVSVVNPLVIRRFSQMRMARAKTDRKDAMLIADYGRTERPPLWEPPKGYIHELQQDNSVLDALVRQRTMLANQKEALSQLPSVSMEAMTALELVAGQLQEQIALLEKAMERKALDNCPELYRSMNSIPGIGPKTAIQLIVITHGFARFENGKQLAAYIGLCPRIFQSGTSVRGKSRICKMGMGRARALLYLCAMTARKGNRACRELYDRMRLNGKPPKVALIAVANKLLKQAFALGTRLEMYSETKYNLATS